MFKKGIGLVFPGFWIAYHLPADLLVRKIPEKTCIHFPNIENNNSILQFSKVIKNKVIKNYQKERYQIWLTQNV